MTKAREIYALDANVFIQAKRRFYGFDFCPGYWRALIWHQRHGNLCSIDRIRDELHKGADDLWDWAESRFGEAAFAKTSEPSVLEAYKQMLTWVMSQTQFHEAAKTEFQDVADGWLAAYAKANNCVVVTLEEFNSETRKKVPLPNLCRAFDVPHITPFEMLHRLSVKLDWEQPA